MDLISSILLEWFEEYGRDLPWRQTYDPYQVWISEIMLQQTQMERGVTFFNRWINRFPNVDSVATASEEEVLRYWEGLGYYSRARNLHHAAKIIVEEYSSVVPSNHKVLLSLPGIGPYTAAAITSIAANLDIPVIDANVYRVYARLFDIDSHLKSKEFSKKVNAIAEKLLPKGKARKYNQAIMDFGGLVCTPKKPKCYDCLLQNLCKACKNNTVANRPVLPKKKEITYKYMVSGFIKNESRILIKKRPKTGAWAGLWEFPGGEVSKKEFERLDANQVQKVIAEACGLPIIIESLIAIVSHPYTRYKVFHACFHCCVTSKDISEAFHGDAIYRWSKEQDLETYAYPAGPRKILQHLKLKS